MTAFQATVSERLENLSIQLPHGGCWLWFGTTDKKTGYGSIRIDGKMVKAHRASWTVHRGRIPAGIKVLHQCDIPNCINPNHLFLGTQLDNIRDMEAKGRRRSAMGQKNGRAKLTAKQVAEIRLAKDTLNEIARAYGVGKSIIGYIRSGQNWKAL